MQPGREIGEFYKAFKPFQLGLSPPMIQAGNKGRSVAREEPNGVATNIDGVVGVTAMHFELRGSARAECLDHTGFEPNPRAGNMSARVSKQL